LLNKFYRRLSVKLAIVLAAMCAIPIFIFGAMLVNKSEALAKKSVLDNNSEAAIMAAREIGLLVKRPEDFLNSTAAMLGVMHLDSWRQETVLVELALNQPIFRRISLLDLSGKVIAASNLGEENIWHLTQEAKNEIFKGKAFISNARFENNQAPYLTYAVSVTELGKISGILIAEVDLRTLWEVMDKVRLGNTGRAFLVYDDGTLIAHPDKKLVLKNENLKDQPDVRDALSGKAGAFEFFDTKGKSWVSSYSPVPGKGWAVVLRQDRREAYKFISAMKAQSWLILLFCEAMMVMAAIFMARMFSNPVRALLDRIKNFNEFGPQDGVGRKRRDEIGELIRAFDDLAAKLKKAKASEKFSSIGEAAAWVAHELKNSLVPIKSFIQALPAKHKDKKFVDRFNDLVPQEISRLEMMLKELSDFSSHSELKFERVNLKETLEGVLKVMEDKFTQIGIGVKISAKNEGIYVFGDSERLKQVFINLIINAINAMPDGGELGISIELSGPYADISISDTGVGIPEEVLKNIFQPYRQAGGKAGAGLGIPISRKIVEQHNGELKVDSYVGIGTTFTVRLPAESREAVS
jgi:signal transduction histidine kinase